MHSLRWEREVQSTLRCYLNRRVECEGGNYKLKGALLRTRRGIGDRRVGRFSGRGRPAQFREATRVNVGPSGGRP
jgi:hypothetical protein